MKMKLFSYLHLTPLISLSLLGLAAVSCSNEKAYTIRGTIDLPAQIPYGDTIIDVPPCEDTWVYLIDLDSEVIDSTQIHNNKFVFKGEINPEDAYFAQATCQLGGTLLVIEPGNIEINITSNITVTGTKSNDCMTDIDAALDNLNTETYNQLAILTDSLRSAGKVLSDSMQMKFGTEFQRAMEHVLDSAYEANKDNQGGVYAVMMRYTNVQSSEELEQALAAYPENIRQNQLLQVNLRLLRYYEMMSSGQLTGGDINSNDTSSTVDDGL